MNGRRLYREYAKFQGCDCVSFVKIDEDWYGYQDFFYLDSQGIQQRLPVSTKDMIRWVIKTLSNDAFVGMGPSTGEDAIDNGKLQSVEPDAFEFVGPKGFK